MKIKSISIIGHFGGGEKILDGQTVKTKILFEELSRAVDWSIKRVDTYYKSKNPLRLVWQTLCALLTTKDVIVLLSVNGMKFYFPILWFCSKVFHTRVYHDVIGGNLGSYVEKYPQFRKFLNSFRVNWVETGGMKEELEAQGIVNAEVLPNFKRLQCVSIEELVNMPQTPPFRFCTFSRVMREKGIEDAINAIEAINAENGSTLCTLDIYGKVDEGYAKCFEELQAGFSDAIAYRGMVDFKDSVQTIKDYYALLFPTFWDGEGFAGTIIDAYAAGLPVIASAWRYNAEIVKEERTGILHPVCNEEALVDCLRYACRNVDKWTAMRYHCLEEAQKYYPDKVVQVIVSGIEGK